MSSYNQVTERRTLAETLGLATTEIMKLYDEMADLCANIAAQFPDTYEDIPRYHQALSALSALDRARDVLDEPLARIDPPARARIVVVTVGKQGRGRRTMSDRVRLGNAVVRLRAVQNDLNDPLEADNLSVDLAEIVGQLEGVTFPERFG